MIIPDISKFLCLIYVCFFSFWIRLTKAFHAICVKYANGLFDFAGSKLSTAEINVWTAGDVGFNNEPNIQKYSRYLLYFESIRDTSRTIRGSSTFFIKYLVDEDGNKITLDGRSNNNLEFIQRLFRNDELATLYVLDAQNSSVSNLSNQNFDIIETGVGYVNVLKPFSDDDNVLSDYITLRGKDTVVTRGRKIKFGS